MASPLDTLRDALAAGETPGHILLVTVVLGGAAAWLTGRATALAWRPAASAAFGMVPLTLAARFIHFALFGGTLLSIPGFARDFGFFLVVGLLAFRFTRVTQMVRQYPWLYARNGPLFWRKIEQEKPAAQC